MIRARNRFYRTMTRIGGNAELARLLPNTQVHLVRTHLSMPPELRFGDYRRIGQAIFDGDEQTAEAAARRHVRRSMARLDELPDKTFGPDSSDRYRTRRDECLCRACEPEDPVRCTFSNCGPTTCQMSDQTSLAGRPRAQGWRSPGMTDHASL